jgi:diadenosine tetraphosphate (Ap4A) HIT family hydrolase
MKLRRELVWEDPHWSLTFSFDAEGPGFCYLELKRHIPDTSALDGEAAHTLGRVMSQVTAILMKETAAEQVYVYIFGGGIDHLHIHLAPHREGEALNDQIIRGELEESTSGDVIVRLSNKEIPILPEEEQRKMAHRVRRRLYESSYE